MWARLSLSLSTSLSLPVCLSACLSFCLSLNHSLSAPFSGLVPGFPTRRAGPYPDALTTTACRQRRRRSRLRRRDGLIFWFLESFFDSWPGFGLRRGRQARNRQELDAARKQQDEGVSSNSYGAYPEGLDSWGETNQVVPHARHPCCVRPPACLMLRLVFEKIAFRRRCYRCRRKSDGSNYFP